MGLLDVLLRKVIRIAGTEMPERKYWNFVSGATAVDNPATGATDITIAGGSGGLPVTRVIRSTAVPSTITTADDLVRVTAVALQTLPAAPGDGHSYEVYNATTGNNDVNGGGHNIDATGAATMTLGPRQAVTFTYCLASTSWMAT